MCRIATPLFGSVAVGLLGGVIDSLLGPLGWGLAVLSVSGPAYRVTVPVCITVAALRKKYAS